jgi:hypothetical protein
VVLQEVLVDLEVPEESSQAAAVVGMAVRAMASW